tara:strand:+ start:770 stop:2020 length:1251 start_codon:yes stop_codon:yes gene_type:complete
MAFASKIIEIFYIIPKILIDPKIDTKELLAEIFFSDKKHLVLKETKEHSDSNKEINSDAEKKAEALYEEIYGVEDAKEQTDTDWEDKFVEYVNKEKMKRGETISDNKESLVLEFDKPPPLTETERKELKKERMEFLKSICKSSTKYDGNGQTDPIFSLSKLYFANLILRKEDEKKKKQKWYQKIYQRYENEINYHIDKFKYMKIIKYHFHMFSRSIMLNSLQIHKIEKIRRGEYALGSSESKIGSEESNIEIKPSLGVFKIFSSKSSSIFKSDYDYYNELLIYLHEVAYPIIMLFVSIIIVTNQSLYEKFKLLVTILSVFLSMYIPWTLMNTYKKIKNMLILAERIIEVSEKSQNLTEKTWYWIFGNFKILFDLRLNHDQILKKYTEELHSSLLYDKFGPFQVFFLNTFKWYYNIK